jgi:hypothetical protein
VGNGRLENEGKINSSESEAVRFMTARVKSPPGYCGDNKKLLEVSSCKY